MKRASLLLITAILLATSCADAQFRKTIYGKGDVTTETRKVETFNSIKVSTGINVFLSQGNAADLRVEADENLHEYILTEVKGGVLNVYTEVNIRDSKKRNVYVTIKEIRSLKTSSAGDIKGLTPIVADLLELSTSSAGDINIEVTAKEIKASTSSSGDITIRGTAETFTGDASSAGNLEALGLIVRIASINVSSAGDASITVTEKLTAKASSAGDIRYKGDPKFIDAHSSSAGSIRGY